MYMHMIGTIHVHSRAFTCAGSLILEEILTPLSASSATLISSQTCNLQPFLIENLR